MWFMSSSARKLREVEKELEEAAEKLLAISKALVFSDDSRKHHENTVRNLQDHIKKFDIRVAEAEEVKKIKAANAEEVKRLKAVNAKLIERINYIENKKN